MTGKVLVAGCGAMGLPMAMALQQADIEVNGYDVRPKEEFGEFSTLMVDQPGPLSPDDVLLLVVRDQQQINDVCFGKQGVFRHNTHPAAVVVSSTVSPRYIATLQQQLPDGVDLVDAPMSGAPIAAEQQTLTFMLGGPDKTLARLMPLFEAMGDRIFQLGDSGQGMLHKVLNNYLAATHVVATRRCLARAAELGVDTEQFLDVVSQSSGANWFASKLPVINWAHENYSKDNTIGIIEKDVLAAMDAVYQGEFENGPDDDDAQSFDRELLKALRTLPDFPGSG